VRLSRRRHRRGESSRTPEQLGLLERFHRTLKAEEVYWQLYSSPQDAREKLEAFRQRYNEIRPHWALVPKSAIDPVTPAERRASYGHPLPLEPPQAEPAEHFVPGQPHFPQHLDRQPLAQL
jgi:transposase InsO family protein